MPWFIFVVDGCRFELQFSSEGAAWVTARTAWPTAHITITPK